VRSPDEFDWYLCPRVLLRMASLRPNWLLAKWAEIARNVHEEMANNGIHECALAP